LAWLLRRSAYVGDFDAEGSVLNHSLHISDLDQVTEGLLERTLDCQLNGCGNCITRRVENELQRSAAKCRTIYSFARRRKQYLFDQIAQVVPVVGLSGSATGVKLVWVVDVHVPIARCCTTVMRSGVPVGMQVAWLSISKTGPRLDLIRVAKVRNCAVTQGPPAAGASVHPPMA
jgi:hypothetical protein